MKFKEGRNVHCAVKRRKIEWIGHTLRRSCFSKQVIKRKIEGRRDVTGRRRRRHKQLLDGLRETKEYWKLKEEALDRTVWKTYFERGFGPVVRQTAR
jgi:hypothetical protein